MQSHDTSNQAPPVSSSNITMEESMRSCLFYFEDAVRSISKSPEEIFAAYGGHLGVSWEVRQEILAGKPLLEWDRISIDEKKRIKVLLLVAEGMPKSAYAGYGIDDLIAPVWGTLREMAFEFISQRSRAP